MLKKLLQISDFSKKVFTKAGMRTLITLSKVWFILKDLLFLWIVKMGRTMDKRTIVFVLLVGMTFFGLNLFFGHQRDAKSREELQRAQAKSAQTQMQQSAEIEKKTAKLSELPVVELYADMNKTTLLGYGLKSDGSTLTLAWDAPLPESVYVDGKEQHLLTQDAVQSGPALYASSSFKHFNIAALPDEGTFDVQLITFPKQGTPNVYYGQLKEGDLSIPQGFISDNALVLHKTTAGWLPIGFYESQGRLFVKLQSLPLLTNYVKLQGSFETNGTLQKTREQKYFVLENAYQQIVFTNVGGSIVEINLPFEGENSAGSVVKEIGFDREIAKNYPANAHFPAHPYLTPGSAEVHPAGKIGGYYPLLRRGVWTNKGTIEIPPQYYALNIVSEYPEMASLIYEVKEFTPTSIVFEAVQPHRKITKTFTLKEGSNGAPYVFDLQVQIDGDSRGLWLSSGIPEVEIMSNNSSPQIQYRLSRKGKSEVQKLDLPKVKELVTVSSVSPDWAVDSNGYLGMILDPLSEIGAGFRATAIAGTQVPTRLSVIDPVHQLYPASKYPGYQVLFPLPTNGGTLKFRIFSGPFEESVLKVVDKIYSDPATGYNPDYIASWTFYGWFSFISEPFAKLLFIVMKFFHSVTNSWGFSIILLTVFLRLLLYPLNAWSIKSMRRMQQLSPQIQAIQAKHKKDPKKAQMEIMALYREKKVNPFTGCVPILIQIPFLIAMFDLLKSSFSLRGASFIPGWIDNLTAPDVIFQWETPIFFIGNQLHLLPILLGVVMFFQQRLSSTAPKDPSKMTDQQRQQKAMGSIMTVVFTVMFYHFPSGLNLYWLSSMLLGIFQQWVTNRVLDKKKEGVEVLVPVSKKKLATKKAK